jgi:predicted MFS family arabinose efflux permease
LFISIALFLWGLGEGMFTYLQPIYLKVYWKAEPVTIGLILSAMGIFMTIAQLPAGWLSDHVGPRPGMWASWVVGTVAALIMASAASLPVFLTGMFLYGLTSFVVAPMNLYMTAVRGNWSIERALVVPSAAFNAGMVLGSLNGGLISGAYGFRMVYYLAAILFVASTVMVFLCHKAPRDAHHELTAHRPNLFRNARFMGFLVLIFITMFALYLPQPMTSVFFESEAKLNLPVIGLLGSIGYLGNAVITFGLQRLSAPAGFLIGQVFVGLYALLLWQGGSPVWYGAGVFFLGGYRLARTMSLAYARRFIRATETGLAYGLIETASGATIILTPYLASLIFTRSPRLVYGVAASAIGVVFLINLAIQLLLRRRRLAVPAPNPLNDTNLT